MATRGKMNARQRAARQRRKMILFAFEIIIILVMVAVLYLVMNKTSEGPKVTVFDTEKLAIPSQVQEMKEEGGTMHGYMNIALFGVDAQTDGQLFKGSRSDSTIIASINMDTGDIKLVSVYRDTYLNIGTDEYQKCNGAYSYGGAEQAVKMLNMNLDMDITNFVAVGYKGLSEVIDGLGGVYVDVDSEELKHINNYQVDVSNVLKCQYTPVTEPGYQLLNGVQATSYCRIRQTKGDDFQRAARQREVIQAIEDRAKEADLPDHRRAGEEDGSGHAHKGVQRLHRRYLYQPRFQGYPGPAGEHRQLPHRGRGGLPPAGSPGERQYGGQGGLRHPH